MLINLVDDRLTPHIINWPDVLQIDIDWLVGVQINITYD